MKVVNIITILAILMLVFAPFAADAQNIFGNKPLPTDFEGSKTFSELVVKILNILLAIVGLIAVIFLVWGGFKYITSAGDEEAVDKAKSTIINALIGVVVVILAFALVRIVASAILGGDTGV